MVAGTKRVPAANSALTAELRRARVINRCSPLGIASGESTTATSTSRDAAFTNDKTLRNQEKFRKCGLKSATRLREITTRVWGCQTILTRQKRPRQPLSSQKIDARRFRKLPNKFDRPATGIRSAAESPFCLLITRGYSLR